MDNPLSNDQNRWAGENRLGVLLEVVRNELKE